MSGDIVFGITLKASGGDAVAGEVRLSRDALREVGDSADQAAASTGKLSEGMARIGQMAVAWLGVSQVVGYTRAIIDSTVAQDRFNSTMAVATGSATSAAAEYEFVRQMSNKLGLEVRSTADAYASFQAASRGTALEGEKARAVFESVSNVSARMSLTGEQSSGVFLALSQMMSKGVVSAEEFRQQLGERLPIATTAGAKALNVTTAEFVNLLNSGKLMSEDFLPKFAVALNEMSGSSGPVTSLQASLNRLSNSFTAIRQELGQEVPIRFVVEGADALMSHTAAVTAAISGVGAAAAAYGAIKLGGMAMEAVAGVQAKTAALVAERAATLAATAAEVEHTAIQLAAARSSAMAAGSTAALTAATEAHTGALAAQSAAQAASSAGMGIARGALLLLGGPVGAITLALGIGAAAWSLWGNSARDSAKAADEALARAKASALDLGVSEKKAIGEELARARAERDRLRNTGASTADIKRADDQAWVLQAELDKIALREKNHQAEAKVDNSAWEKLTQTRAQQRDAELANLNAEYHKRLDVQRLNQEEMLKLAEQFEAGKAKILDKYKEKNPAADKAASLANALAGERAGLESAVARNGMDVLPGQAAARIEAERALARAQEDARYQAKEEAMARELTQMRAHGELSAQTAALQAQRMEVLEKNHQESLTAIERKAERERDQLKEKQDAAAYRAAQALGSETAGLDTVRGQNALADPGLQGDAKVLAGRAIAQASEDAKYQIQVDAMNRETELMAQRGELTEQSAATQARRLEVLEETHQARRFGIMRQYMTEKEKFDAMSWDRQVGYTSSKLMQMTQVSATQSMAMFNINKVASLSHAAVSGGQAVMDAYKFGAELGGPIGGGLAAAAAVVETGAILAQINSAQFGGGTSTPASIGASGGIPSQAAATSTPVSLQASDTAQQAQPPITFNLYANGTFVGDRDFVENSVMPHLKDVISNSDVVVIDPRSRQAQMLRA